MTDQQNDATADDDLVPAVPLKPEESWIDRERRISAEREQRIADERAENERRTEAAIARMRALSTDNGSGFCKYCGVKFSHDEQERPMHPANECAGAKPGPCPVCHAEPELRLRGGFRTWEYPCGPADHARARGQQNPAQDIDIQRPRRVSRDDDSEEYDR